MGEGGAKSREGARLETGVRVERFFSRIRIGGVKMGKPEILAEFFGTIKRGRMVVFGLKTNFYSPRYACPRGRARGSVPLVSFPPIKKVKIWGKRHPHLGVLTRLFCRKRRARGPRRSGLSLICSQSLRTRGSAGGAIFPTHVGVDRNFVPSSFLLIDVP